MPTPEQLLVQAAPYDSLILEDDTKLYKFPYSTIVQIDSKNGGLRDAKNPDNGNVPDKFLIDAFASEFLSVYGSDNEYITLTSLDFDTAMLRLDLGDTVTVRLPRFDLSAGKDYRIVGITYQLRERKITFNLWGGDLTPYTFSESIGYTGPDEFWVYERVENDGAYPTGFGWMESIDRRLQRPYSQYTSGTQWQRLCLTHKRTTRSTFPVDPLVTYQDVADGALSPKPVVTWYPATGEPGVLGAYNVVSADLSSGSPSSLWAVSVIEAGILHICPKSNLQIKVTVTPNIAFNFDYAWQYIYWPPPSPDTRAYTGTEECWAYGYTGSVGAGAAGIAANPMELLPELVMSYDTHTHDFMEITGGDNAEIYFVRKVVSRSGGSIVSESDDLRQTGVVVKWTPYVVGTSAPVAENVSLVDGKSAPSCLWRVIGLADGFFTVNYGGNLELVYHIWTDPTYGNKIVTWQYVYYDPTATPDPNPPNPPEFTIYTKGVTESVSPSDSGTITEVAWGIAESVTATATASVAATNVTRNRVESVIASSTVSATLT